MIYKFIMFLFGSIVYFNQLGTMPQAKDSDGAYSYMQVDSNLTGTARWDTTSFYCNGNIFGTATMSLSIKVNNTTNIDSCKIIRSGSSTINKLSTSTSWVNKQLVWQDFTPVNPVKISVVYKIKASSSAGTIYLRPRFLAQ